MCWLFTPGAKLKVSGPFLPISRKRLTASEMQAGIVSWLLSWCPVGGSRGEVAFLCKWWEFWGLVPSWGTWSSSL